MEKQDIALILFSNGYTESQNNRQWSARISWKPLCYIRCMVQYECKMDQSVSMCTCLIVRNHIPFPARHCNNTDQKQFYVLY